MTDKKVKQSTDYSQNDRAKEYCQQNRHEAFDPADSQGDQKNQTADPFYQRLKAAILPAFFAAIHGQFALRPWVRVRNFCFQRFSIRMSSSVVAADEATSKMLT